MASQETIEGIVDYYVNLLIIQYNSKPKARATIDAIVREVIASGVLLDIQDGYNLETAIGTQLDILGKYIGIDRFYLSTEFDDFYFGFADAEDMAGTSPNIVGFDDAAAPDKTGLFLDASDVISKQFRLNDDAYRFLLKLKIVQNYSNHSAESIDAAMSDFFAGDIIFKDNYDMTITYFISAFSSALIKAALNKKVFPKPMAVRLEAIKGGAYFAFADATKLSGLDDFYTNDSLTDQYYVNNTASDSYSAAGGSLPLPSYMLGFNDATVGLTKAGRFLNTTNDIIS